MLKLLVRNTYRCSTTHKVPTIDELKVEWNEFSHRYRAFQYFPQTFYYTLSNMLKLNEAQNILEVGCGTGTLLPLMVQMKRPETRYLASDLSANMVQYAEQNLKKHFETYESKITFEQWVGKHNIRFKALNGEQPFGKQNKEFDRIICNLCLMLTTDPKKMLNNLHAHAKPGCLLGVSVWGDIEKSSMMHTLIGSILQSGVQPPKERSPFHLYQKVPALAEETGWDIISGWKQNIPAPITETRSDIHKKFSSYFLTKLPEEQRPKVAQIFEKKLNKLLKTKKVMESEAELFILKRK